MSKILTSCNWNKKSLLFCIVICFLYINYSTGYILSKIKSHSISRISADKIDSSPGTLKDISSRITTITTSDNVKKKVYEPRSDNKKPTAWSRPTPNQQNSVNDDSKRSGSFYQLTKPQLLIKYRASRVKSEMKLLLEASQETFRQQNDRYYDSSMSSSRSTQIDDRRTGSSGSGSGSSSSAGGSTFSNSIGNSASSKYSKKSTKGGSRQDSNNHDEERRTSKSFKGDRKFDDTIESDVLEYDTNDVFGGGVDDSYVSLSTLSGDVLREMENEGFTLDEIQMSIFGEYGIKASIPAIRRRLQDDKIDRKNRRSGKTRRQKQKARNMKFQVDTSNLVELPTTTNIVVSELAGLIGVSSGEVVKHLMLNVGMMVTMNMNVDMTIARDVVVAFGKIVNDNNDLDEDEDEEDEEMDADDIDTTQFIERPPVVTIMGHVDHGKTTLLDRIRKYASLEYGETLHKHFIPVAPGEAGGITQSISAFKVKTGSEKFVTFIDTPGHAAFSEMRKRGANVTDIVILVVAADDGIMEQTKECIFAAKAAGCPIVVAVNKIDKEGADAQAVITDLMSYDILAEEFGGEVQVAKLSAKQGIGIEGLLEKVLLQADLMNLKAVPSEHASGTIIESRIDKRLGILATVMVQKGILKVGDAILAGPAFGKVRKMLSDQGEALKEAGPSTPVQILGFGSVPIAGDEFSVVDDESAARDVADARSRIAKQSQASSSISSMISQAALLSGGGLDNREILKVPLLLKGDVTGSVEALRDSLIPLQEADNSAICMVDIVSSGIGEITASDIAIAAVAKAKILAFNVAAKSSVLELARSSNVEIGFYNVVYDLLDEVAKTVKDTLSPPPPGILVGKAEIKKAFKVGKSGKVAGCLVIEGVIKSGSKIRVMRGNRNPIHTGLMSSLQFGKEKVNEVVKGSECGISIEDFQDFAEGDIIECFSSNDDSQEVES